MRLFLDNAGGSVGLIARLKLVSELGKVRKELLSLPKDGARAMLARVKLTSRALELRLELGVKQAPPQAVSHAESTKNLYEFDESRKTAQRRRENQAAMDLLNAVNSGGKPESELTEEDLATLAKYSGTGGGMVGADGKVGSQYEYYTPAPLAQGAWDLLKELGFEGGKVLDPSAGTGIFGATAPDNAVVDAIELDQTSGRINQLVNQKDNVTISAFESVAASTPDEIYDAVVTNIPFGDVASRGKERFKDTKYQNETLEGYFILRSLEKLRPGGLACFISSKGFMSNRGAKDSNLRYRASLMAEFMGAYRLPNKMFDSTGADVTTDVLVFKKFGRDAIRKIEELLQQNPESLREANVLWEPFLDGKYYNKNPKNILGSVETGKGRYGDVERVVSDDSISNISRMMRRFGGSRISWDSLSLIETAPIEYRDGDSVTRAGVTFTMRDGRFEPVEPTGADQELAEKVTASSTPNKAIEEGVKWGEANQIIDSLMARSQYADMPKWLFDATKELKEHAPKTRRAELFEALKVAMATSEALDRHTSDADFNYAEAYPFLHAAIPSAAKLIKRVPAGLATELKQVLGVLSSGAVYDRKNDSFSDRWMGVSANHEVVISDLKPTQKYEHAKYQFADDSGFVPMDKAREIMGDELNLDDDAWCISADGSGVMSADDYYTGNYADFKKRHALALDSVTDEAIKRKLIDQATAADSRLIKPDVSALSFTLFSPYVSTERKAEFLSKYVDAGFSVDMDDDGKPQITFRESDSKLSRNSEEMRNMKRFVDYVRNGTLSTRTKREEKAEDPELERVRVERLREMISRSNQQFEAWTKSNPAIQDDLNSRFSDPKNLYFKQVDDNSPLDIPGINPNLVPHGYQNACIRQYARRMSGIMGLDVGLGKTFTALLTVQHVQSIGVKKKTIFVVPNSTLSNWKKETETAYLDTSDCLFVGMSTGRNGEDAVNPRDYARDLSLVLSNQHRKIYMTYEAFAMIRLKDETKDEYTEYMRIADKSFDDSGESNKSKSVKKEGRLAKSIQGAGKGSAAAPYLEDMGVDSIIIDEGHSFKNSKGTTEFKAAKFLASPTVSNRGQDAQIKCWYIRGLSPLGDGVIPLTATPITNSPLEIYSMLTLAVGEVELNNRMGGVRGADDFMEAFCDITEDTVTNLSGFESMSRVFTGLTNTEMLRDVLGEVATIRTAKEVGLKIPEIDEQQTPVQLSEPPIMEELVRLQRIYTAASLMARNQSAMLALMPGNPEQEVNDEIDKTGEDIELLAHPFNFINKVSRLIADPELHEQKTVFIISDESKARKAIDAFNKKAYREERQRPTPLQKESNIVRTTSKKVGEDTVELMIVKVEAFLLDGRVEVDTVDFKIQGEFIKIAEKLGLDLDVTLPPKIAAMLENFQKEQATPQAKGKAKQLIFCDMLGLHNKLKLVLQKRAGVPSSAISIINGVSVTDPADMQDIQDGFNAEGEDNRYLVVIANKKAEVGINLQKGTQAIHHLTVGYTPDSIHQRNGRGARQGNYVDNIRVYHYDANGTFDQYKRSIVSKKSDWIGEVMAGSGNKVKVSGGMSREDVQMLAEAAGSEEGMRKAQERIALREEMERKKSAQSAIVSNLMNMETQQAVIERYPNFESFFIEQVIDAAELRFTLRAAERRLKLANDSGDEVRVKTATSNLSRIKGRYDAAMKPILETATVQDSKRYKSWEQAFDSRSWLETPRGSGEPKGIDRSSISREVGAAIRGDSWTSLGLAINEGSIIHENWQIEVSSAENLAKEAEQKAMTLLDAAGMDPDRINAVKSGSASIKRGTIVSAGDFVVDRQEEIWIFTSPDRLFYYSDTLGNTIDGGDGVIMAGTIVTREMEGYSKVVERAAAIDSKRLSDSGGALGPREKAYYQFNPDVANKLDSKPLMQGHERGSRLSEGDFKEVLPKKAYEDPIMSSIYEAQSKLITFKDDNSGYFIYDPSVVEVERGGYSTSERVQALGKVALLTGNRVTTKTLIESSVISPLASRVGSDAARYVAAFAATVYGWPTEQDIRSLVSGSSADTEAYEALRSKITERFSEMIAPEVLSELNVTGVLPQEIKDLYVDLVLEMKKSDTSAHGDEGASDEVSGAAASLDPNELVAIIGNTYEFKDTIKSVATDMGIKAKFRGKWANKQLPSAPQNSWVVPRKVYDKLLADHADGVRRNDITIA